MTAWSKEELTQISETLEIRIAGRRTDGSLHKAIIIWAVEHGGDVYVRSVNGPDAGWYQGTQEQGLGHIWAGNLEKDVVLTRVGDVDDALDAAYRAKYSSTPSDVELIVHGHARGTTLRVDPA